LEDAIDLSGDGLRDDDDNDNDDDDDDDDYDDVLVSPERRLVTTVLATPDSTFIYFLRYVQGFFSI